MAEERVQACGVCGRMLAWLEPTFGEPQWIHTPDVIVDHPAIAVDVSINARQKCDFCSTEMHWREGWIVPSPSFQMRSGHMSEGDWKSCDRCVQFIISGETRQLAFLLVDYMWGTSTIPDNARDMAANDLTQLYDQLAAHMGTPYPVTL